MSKVRNSIYTELRKEYPRTWRIWYRMNRRCEIGERGYDTIEVCDEWNRNTSAEMGFVQFLDDMGPCEDPLYEIQRIDTDYHYTPGNCEWINDRGQAQYRRKPWRTPWGRTILKARALGIPYNTLWGWRQQGKDYIALIKAKKNENN